MESMTEELDLVLRRLAGRPADPRLDAATANVLDRLAAAPVSRPDNFRLAGALVAVIGMSIGIAGGWVQRTQDPPAIRFDTARALAPSTLLGDG